MRRGISFFETDAVEPSVLATSAVGLPCLSLILLGLPTSCDYWSLKPAELGPQQETHHILLMDLTQTGPR